jgi:hypothetical protein
VGGWSAAIGEALLRSLYRVRLVLVEVMPARPAPMIPVLSYL